MSEPEPGAVSGDSPSTVLTPPAPAEIQDPVKSPAGGDSAPAVTLTEALAEIGRPPLEVVLHAFSHIVLIRRVEDVSLLEHFLELLSGQCDRRAAQILVDQLAKLNAGLQRGHPAQLAHRCEDAKVRIHRILLALGEKGAVDDLLQMLGDGRRRVRDGVVEMIARTGDRRALVPLVRLCHLEEAASGSGAAPVREALVEIARRGQVTSDDKHFKDLTAPERAVLKRALGGTAGATR